ncbi:MAG: hypothetical protein R2883_06465 [Caldisericia bacterium]
MAPGSSWIDQLVKIGDCWLESKNHKLICYDDDENELWIKEDKLYRLDNMKFYNEETILFFDNDRTDPNITCLDVKNGQEKWNIPGTNLNLWTKVVLDGKILIPGKVEDQNFKLYYIDIETGEISLACESHFSKKDKEFSHSPSVYSLSILEDMILINNSICLVKRNNHKQVIIPENRILFEWTKGCIDYLSETGSIYPEFWGFESTAKIDIFNNSETTRNFEIVTTDTDYQISETSFNLEPGKTKVITFTQNLLTHKIPIEDEYKHNNGDLRTNEKHKFEGVTVKWDNGKKHLPVTFGYPCYTGVD